MDADLLFAIQLQEEYDREEAGESRPGQGSNAGCAGVCSYEGRGGLCSIRLSKPLLTLRPRKDLVETLLHEMIHALLFVTDNNKDHDGHGPEFHKHMNRINGVTGAKISVYHSFHDEVDEYRKHWWQCNGPCQQRPPYYGYVKRAMNRAPSKLDPWWADHQRSCGGTYTKVKEPEKKTGKDKKKEDSSEVQPSNIPEIKGKPDGGDIRSFFPFSGIGYKLGASSQVSVLVKVQSVPPSSSKASSNSPVKPVHTTSALSSFTNKSMNPRPKVSVANTKAFKNVNGSPIRLPVKSQNVSKPSGSKLGTQKRLSFEVPTTSRVATSTSQGSSHRDESQDRPPKRPRVDTKTSNTNFPGGDSFREEPVIVLDGSSTSNPNSQSKTVNCPVCGAKVAEAKINEHLDNCLNG
ncbi:DNA-dependent metalloprotease SPRTN isoform X2 [Rhinoderma darwinii]|uniref:DNA-dependent metalloprotease SPRTN isoform X2 n=1 Tax=Rhinoderma darwinii TaxID=43563 RepID=UPI003F67C4A5